MAGATIVGNEDEGFQQIKGPSARLLVQLCIAAVIVYQIVLMTLWYSFPAWDWFLLRVSLSFADIIAVLALSLALYAYSLQERSLQSDDLAYFQEFINALRRAGVDPRKVERLARSTMGFADAHETRDHWLEEIEEALALPHADVRAAAFRGIVAKMREYNALDRRHKIKLEET